jgi:hypothetical protein
MTHAHEHGSVLVMNDYAMHDWPQEGRERWQCNCRLSNKSSHAMLAMQWMADAPANKETKMGRTMLPTRHSMSRRCVDDNNHAS